MSLQEQINKIISSRKSNAEKVAKSYTEWEKYKFKCNDLHRLVEKLNKICEKNKNVSENSFIALNDYLKKLQSEQVLQTMQGNINSAISNLKILKERFNRNELNIVVAGIGRCGKSTTLKSILGIDHNNNDVIPSSNTPAVTAGKSTISYVDSKEKEKTKIKFHTEVTFLDVINVCLKEMGITDFLCDSLDDFEYLNIDDLKTKMETESHNVEVLKNDAIEDAKRKDIDYLSDPRYLEALGKSEKLKRAEKYLALIRSMHKKFNEYKHLLNGEIRDVPLEQTYQYISYPNKSDGRSHRTLCYAVQECEIFCKFPSVEVSGLQLVDLPGLGTGNPMEENYFQKGFGYFVDLALLIRRPEGLQSNAATDDDMKVYGILEEKLKSKFFNKRVVLFQNDGGLDKVQADSAYDALKKEDKYANLTIIRGDAKNQKEIQDSVLPNILKFMLKNIPDVDDDLVKTNYESLDQKQKEIESEFQSIDTKLRNICSKLPKDGNVNAINEKVELIRIELMNRIRVISEKYSVIKGQDEELEKSVKKIHNRLNEEIKNRYDFKDAKKIKDAENRIELNSRHSYVFENLRNIRINIAEQYSNLEKFHTRQVENLQNDIAITVKECFPNIFSEEDSLNDIASNLEEEQNCPTIFNAISFVLDLKIPFFYMVYPELRKDIFSPEKIKEMETDILSNYKSAKDIIYSLCIKANDLNDATYRALKNPLQMAIVFGAIIDRFGDIMWQSKEAKEELGNLVQSNWSKVSANGNAYITELFSAMDSYFKKFN